MQLKKICVFCGSNLGKNPIFTHCAEMLATTLVTQNMSLIYGGAKVGLMGILADAVLHLGGEVIGVIPEFLVEKEIAHHGITTLHIVKTMHQRKALMAELADGFIMLPGGIGSLDEFFEIVTWAQLGFHGKPCGILNVAHYYDDLLKFLDHAVTMEFLHSSHRQMMMVEESPQKLLERFATHKAPTKTKWTHMWNADGAL